MRIISFTWNPFQLSRKQRHLCGDESKPVTTTCLPFIKIIKLGDDADTHLKHTLTSLQNFRQQEIKRLLDIMVKDSHNDYEFTVEHYYALLTAATSPEVMQFIENLVVKRWKEDAEGSRERIKELEKERNELRSKVSRHQAVTSDMRRVLQGVLNGDIPSSIDVEGTIQHLERVIDEVKKVD